MSVAEVVTAPAWRRVAATAVDYGLVGGWALVLAGVTATVSAGRGLPALSPGAGQLLGLATLTAPATLALAVAEARGGSPGKRLLGLRLETTGARQPAFGTALSRTLAKVALPWELAHAGAWQFAVGAGGALAAGATAGAYLALGVAAAGLLRGGPWYDRLCGTRVVSRQLA